MPVSKYHRLEIARAHIHRAVVLFLEERDYLNAITLAGAGEEVLGGFVRRANETALAQDTLVDAIFLLFNQAIPKKVIRDEYLNKTRNCLKHFDAGDEEEIEIDLQSEAITMITRALLNWMALNNKLDSHMELFVKEADRLRPTHLDPLTP